MPSWDFGVPIGVPLFWHTTMYLNYTVTTIRELLRAESLVLRYLGPRTRVFGLLGPLAVCIGGGFSGAQMIVGLMN